MTAVVPRSPIDDTEFWEFRLYVIGRTPKSLRAIANLKKLCEENFQGRYEIEVVDLAANPSLARSANIFATPAVVRQSPKPPRTVIGDLSDIESVLTSLRS